MTESRTLHLLGALGLPRTELVNGQEHLVVPVVALIEGVIHSQNADHPEFVPADTLMTMAESFNGKPVTLGHPRRDGKHVSAHDVFAQRIGHLRNPRVTNKKLLMDALIEKATTKALHPELYQRLAAGGTEEVSIGALVVCSPQSGMHSGKSYLGTWTKAEGDHLAFLPHGTGACSVAAGCGTHRAAMRMCADSFELETLMDSSLEKELKRRVPGFMRIVDIGGGRGTYEARVDGATVTKTFTYEGSAIITPAFALPLNQGGPNKGKVAEPTPTPDPYAKELAALRAAESTPESRFEDTLKADRMLEVEQMRETLDANPLLPRMTTAETADYAPPDPWQEGLDRLRAANARAQAAKESR